MTSPVGYQSQTNHLPAPPVSDAASTQINQVSTAIFIKTGKQSRSGSPIRISPPGSPVKEHEEHLLIQTKAFEERCRQLDEELQAIDEVLANLQPHSREAFEKERIRNLTTCDLQIELDDLNWKIRGYENSKKNVSRELDYYNHHIQKQTEQALETAKVVIEGLKKLNAEGLIGIDQLLATIQSTSQKPLSSLKEEKGKLETKLKELEANLKTLEKRKELLLARQKELTPEEDSSVSPSFFQEIEIPSAPKDSPALVRLLFASDKEKSQILEAESQELARLNSVLANKKEQLATQQPMMPEPDGIEVKRYHHFIHGCPNPRSRVSDGEIKTYEERIKQAQNNLSLLTAFANIPQHWPLA